LTTTKGAIYKFDGFVDTDLEKIKPYIEGPYENELDIVPLATKGWNWGEVDFQGKMLRSQPGPKDLILTLCTISFYAHLQHFNAARL
jgi:hypothetical protein